MKPRTSPSAYSATGAFLRLARRDLGERPVLVKQPGRDPRSLAGGLMLVRVEARHRPHVPRGAGRVGALAGPFVAVEVVDAGHVVGDLVTGGEGPGGRDGALAADDG